MSLIVFSFSTQFGTVVLLIFLNYFLAKRYIISLIVWVHALSWSDAYELICYMFGFSHRHWSPIDFVLSIEGMILLSLEKYSMYIIINALTNKTSCQFTLKSWPNKLCAQYLTGIKEASLRSHEEWKAIDTRHSTKKWLHWDVLEVGGREKGENYCFPIEIFGEGNGKPLQYSCLENSMDDRAWCATVHEVTKSWTTLSN